MEKRTTIEKTLAFKEKVIASLSKREASSTPFKNK